MGTLQAQDMSEHAPDLTTLLTWHLRHNHYPPVPLSMVPVCEQAMDAVLADEPDNLIELPENTLYRGRTEAPAWAIVDAHRLHSFIEQEGGY